jgi:hypothetical protein
MPPQIPFSLITNDAVSILTAFLFTINIPNSKAFLGLLQRLLLIFLSSGSFLGYDKRMTLRAATKKLQLLYLLFWGKSFSRPSGNLLGDLIQARTDSTFTRNLDYAILACFLYYFLSMRDTDAVLVELRGVYVALSGAFCILGCIHGLVAALLFGPSPGRARYC